MKLIKVLGVILITVIFLYAFAVKFSAVESRFQCSGEISSKDKEKSLPVEVYIKLEEYRWWVGLWSESDASLHLEIPNTSFDYFERLKKVGDQYHIFDSQKNLSGNFSMLSKALAINTSDGFFDGVCKKNN